MWTTQTSANSEQLQYWLKYWGLEGFAVEIQYKQITTTMQLLRGLHSNAHSCCGCKMYTEPKVWKIHAEAMAINGWMLDFSSNRTPVSLVVDIHLLTFHSFLGWYGNPGRQHVSETVLGICSAISTPPKPHYLQGFMLDRDQETALSSCRAMLGSCFVSNRWGSPRRWSKVSLNLFRLCFLERNSRSQSAHVQKGSLSCLILQDISYREQVQTTHTIFSVFFVSFSLSELPGAWLVLAQACCAALHGWRTCPSPRGLVGVHFLLEEHVQQSTKDCSCSHANSLSSEGHAFSIKCQ